MVPQQAAAGAAPSAIVEANWLALVRHLVASTGGRLEETDRLFRFATGLHSGFLNGIMRVDLSASADVEGDLRAIAAETSRLFAAGDTPWRWLVGPGTRPADLATHLPGAGLEPHAVLELMIRDPGPLPEQPPAAADGLVVREVLDAGDLEGWLHVRRANMGLDDRTIGAWRRAHGSSGLGPGGPLRHFVGSIEGRPVAAATLFLDHGPGGPSAGIYHVDTVPDQRRRGFGRATTLAALEAAGSVGIDRAVLTATELGRSVYEALGFRALGPVEIFRAPVPALRAELPASGGSMRPGAGSAPSGRGAAR